MEQTNKTVEQKESIDIVNTHFNGNLKYVNSVLKKMYPINRMHKRVQQNIIYQA